MHEDFAIWLRILKTGRKAYGIDAVSYTHLSFAGYGYAPSRLPAAGTGKVPGMAEKKRRGGAGGEIDDGKSFRNSGRR